MRGRGRPREPPGAGLCGLGVPPRAVSGVGQFFRLGAHALLACRVQIATNFIGMGYYGTLTPGVILRNMIENPGFYTAYTPYQAEVSQGRLESLLNFQTMVRWCDDYAAGGHHATLQRALRVPILALLSSVSCWLRITPVGHGTFLQVADLTGMQIANASLLDEGTAAAEAVNMCVGMSKHKKFFVADDVHPQTIGLVKTRAKALDVKVIVGPADKAADTAVAGALLQYPNTRGDVLSYGASCCCCCCLTWLCRA